MPKNATAGSYNKSTFSFDRSSQSIFKSKYSQSGYTILHSPQQGICDIVFPISSPAIDVITLFHFSHFDTWLTVVFLIF